MVNHSSMEQTATVGRCCVVLEPDLRELLRDPMTVALMQADRVDRRAFEALIAGTRENLRWHRANRRTNRRLAANSVAKASLPSQIPHTALAERGSSDNLVETVIAEGPG